MNRTFRIVAELNYEMDSRKRSDAEFEAEARFIKRLGDDLSVVKKIDELEWANFKTEEG